MPTKIEISHRTILFTLVVLALVWLVLEVREILFLLFVSFILMSALRPLVDAIERKKVPRIVAILLIYILVFGLFSAGIAGIIPAVVAQSRALVEEFPDISAHLGAIPLDLQSLINQLTPVSQNIFRVTLGVFSNFVTVITVLTFTFYFLLERRNLRDFLTGLLGDSAGETVFGILLNVEKRLSAWVLGQLTLMFIIGLLVYIGLYFLRVEFALPLAILAGLLEIVPTVGPIISAIPAIVVAFVHAPLLALSVAALYIIIQQVENNLIVPYVMKKSVGLSPVLSLLALMIGGRLAGIGGAVLSVPVLLAAQEIIATLPNTFSSRSNKKSTPETS
jgi:predicted PurR-regulated permease PerM